LTWTSVGGAVTPRLHPDSRKLAIEGPLALTSRAFSSYGIRQIIIIILNIILIAC